MMLVGDALHLPVAASTVQCCVTSPPYWGLRDYGVPGQLGLESTPDAYVASMVAVFREVWRVLRDDGTVWCNLGDSYATGTSTASKPSVDTDNGYWQKADKLGRSRIDGRECGLKPKDLVGIPWRVAFALQSDGWYLRQDIIWAKPNPMPESVRDRCTKAHEYIFLLTKRQRYYYDAEAIAEESVDPESLAGRKKRTINTIVDHDPGYDGHRTRTGLLALNGQKYPTRNRRSVWTVNTQPYPEAHFATFPEKLVEPCILAGTKPGDLVLDPFAGSGTVGAVCRRLARKFVGIELNPAYVALAVKRLKGQIGMALEGVA